MVAADALGHAQRQPLTVVRPSPSIYLCESTAPSTCAGNQEVPAAASAPPIFAAPRSHDGAAAASA